jgi:PLP dependent protein
MSDLAENLRAVRARIDAAARAAGRDPSEVSLLAVSKTWPADAVRALAALGQRDFGENRAQELLGKAGELSDLALRWHFIGQLQRNKAASVARYAHVVHSVDREALVGALSKGAVAAARELDVLVQVDLDPPGHGAGRGGVVVGELTAVAEQVLQAPGLALRGVMGVAPLGGDPAEAFTRLAAASQVLRRSRPDATWISAGMSEDLEQAVACGATHLRVGSAVLGSRPSLG